MHKNSQIYNVRQKKTLGIPAAKFFADPIPTMESN